MRYPNPRYLRFESNRLRIIRQIVFSWEILSFFYFKYFHLTQHHSGVIPHVVDFAFVRKVFKTVSGSEYVAVRYQASSAPTSPVGPRGFQEQQSRPGELVNLGLLPANREGLVIKNVYF